MQLSSDHNEVAPSSEESPSVKQEELDSEAATLVNQDHTKNSSLGQAQPTSMDGTAEDTTTIDNNTKKATASNTALQPVNIPHESNQLTNAPTETIEAGTLADTLNSDKTTNLSHLAPPPSSFLPGTDGTILPTTKPMTSTSETDNDDTNCLLSMEISDFQLSSLPNMAPFDFTQAQALSQAQPPSFFNLPTDNNNSNSSTNNNMDLTDAHKSEYIQNMVSNYGSHEEFASAHPYLAELLQREISHQKIRADNRERKKRWRELNEERNKDNDLRCRVNKRANKLFGKEESEIKQQWVKEEFMKRQFKRKDKERRKTEGPNDTGHLPLLQDAYLSMLFNNMSTLPPSVALKLMDGIKLMETTIKNAGEDNTLPQQLADFLQQLQQASTISSPASSCSPPPLDPSPSVPKIPATTDKLSALLIQTLQQTAPQDKIEPIVPSSPATTEYSDHSHHSATRLYPMEAIMTLMKVNAEWARQ
ncbi:hypothetical protein BC941DRAFT_429365 [Chlamydoabsidia padenii]|nr:hypothetical protein BC941DRAFT_429365 [Chlamydoabsidia padenii]